MTISVKLVDLIRDWLPSLKLPVIPTIEDYGGDFWHLRLPGPFKTNNPLRKMFNNQNICQIHTNHVFWYAHEYDLNTLNDVYIEAGSEDTIYAADPEFFKKMEAHIRSSMAYLYD